MTGEQTPGTNLRRSHVNGFLTSLGRHVPLKINITWGLLKFGERIFFGEDGVFHMKEFRTNLIYIYIFIHM